MRMIVKLPIAKNLHQVLRIITQFNPNSGRKRYFSTIVTPRIVDTDRVTFINQRTTTDYTGLVKRVKSPMNL